MEQVFRWNKETIPKIFEQILRKNIWKEQKIFAQIVFQLYLDDNDAHTRFIPAG